MVTSNDFFVNVGMQEEGLDIFLAQIFGGVIYMPDTRKIAMISRTGELGSFYFPKGKPKIINGFVEDPISCAIRETREELLEPRLEPHFNGFSYTLFEKTDYPKTRERWYKTITLFGFDYNTPLDLGEIGEEGRIIKVLPSEDAKRYARPDILPVLLAYGQFLKTH